MSVMAIMHHMHAMHPHIIICMREPIKRGKGFNQ